MYPNNLLHSYTWSLCVNTVLLWSHYDTGRGYFVVLFVFQCFSPRFSPENVKYVHFGTYLAISAGFPERRLDDTTFQHIHVYVVPLHTTRDLFQRSLSPVCSWEETTSPVPLDAIVSSLILFTTMIVLAHTSVPDEPINNQKVTRTIITTFLGHPKISKRFNEGNLSFSSPPRRRDPREKENNHRREVLFSFPRN